MSRPAPLARPVELVQTYYYTLFHTHAWGYVHMWEVVQLALGKMLVTLGSVLLHRQRRLTTFSGRRPMREYWEEVLGQQVLFRCSPDGRWTWTTIDLEVRADPNVWFRSMRDCRLAFAAMAHAFFTMEEVTSEPVAVSTSPSFPPEMHTSSPLSPPPQGGGGD